MVPWSAGAAPGGSAGVRPSAASGHGRDPRAGQRSIRAGRASGRRAVHRGHADRSRSRRGPRTPGRHIGRDPARARPVRGRAAPGPLLRARPRGLHAAHGRRRALRARGAMADPPRCGAGAAARAAAPVRVRRADRGPAGRVAHRHRPRRERTAACRRGSGRGRDAGCSGTCGHGSPASSAGHAGTTRQAREQRANTDLRGLRGRRDCRDRGDPGDPGDGAASGR